MAAKRFLDEHDSDHEQITQKRLKKRPSFASVIREVVTVNFFENMCSTMEPMLRRVVSEEVESGLRRSNYPSNLLLESSSSLSPTTFSWNLRLSFPKRISLPIFTGCKVVDKDNNPLQILVVDTNGHVQTFLPYPIRVEILVLDGDFNTENTWTSEQFDRNIVKERTGKRPLLTGECNVTLRDGAGWIGDIEFTDNSSWIRSRKFRLGARVVRIKGKSNSTHVVIREGMTEPFVVKDHRGELYKKHHPPSLEDQVWRLEKIGKGGVFHQKLESEDIKTVQDFLKLFTIDSSKLRRIMGVGMSDKMWEATLKHARTCVLGTKLYISQGNNYSLTLSPICQLLKIEINGQVYLERDLKKMHTAYIESLVKDAYANWDSLEEVEGLVHEGTAPLLIKGGDDYPSPPGMILNSYAGRPLLTDGSSDVDSMANTEQGECSNSEWLVNSKFLHQQYFY